MEKKFRKPVNEILLPDILDGDGDIIPIIADGDDGELEDVDVPEVIPILSLRNTVLFPGVVLPISIGRPKSIQLIKDAYRNDKIVGTVAQKDPDTENPEFKDLAYCRHYRSDSQAAGDARRVHYCYYSGPQKNGVKRACNRRSLFFGKG